VPAVSERIKHFTRLEMFIAIMTTHRIELTYRETDIQVLYGSDRSANLARIVVNC